MSAPNAPYGGRLVDLLAAPGEREALAAHASTLPSLTLSDRSVHDLELLASGAFSPLDRFLSHRDYERVLDEMRLADGTLWPMPITLPVADAAQVRLGAEICLRSPRNEPLAVMRVEEAYAWDAEREARALFGRHDLAHPLVAEMSGWGRVNVSGHLRVLSLPRYYDFVELRRTPV